MSRTRVRISTLSRAALQHGFIGDVVAKSRETEDVLVDLQPNAVGRYGGPHWFPIGDLEEFTEGRWGPLNPASAIIDNLPYHVPAERPKSRRTVADPNPDRDTEIVRAFRNGKTVAALAREYDLTRARVNRIIRRALPR